MSHVSSATDPRPTGHLSVAVLAAAVTAVLVVLAAVGGATGLIAGVALAQLGLIAAWGVGVPAPGVPGLIAIGLLAAAAADVALRVRSEDTSVSTLIGVIGLAFLAMIIWQLVRRPPREHVTISIATTGPVVVAVTALGSLLVLREIAEGPDLLAASLLSVGVALIVGHLVDAVFPVPRFARTVQRGLTALVAGAAAAAAAAAIRLHGVDTVGVGGAVFFGAALGLVAGLIAVGVAYVEATVTPRKLPLAAYAIPYLQIAVPLALSAPVGYLLGRAVTG
ncbi:MAG TPA: hypothetical protein VHC49_24520 [Mycobacteriales bacterium]|nr:hypothetical protein [Mycobacteriales bacterium]